MFDENDEQDLRLELIATLRKLVKMGAGYYADTLANEIDAYNACYDARLPD